MVVIDGKRYNGRLAAIVLWLVGRAERINGQQRVKLEFDCAGNRVVPRCAVYEDDQPIRIGD